MPDISEALIPGLLQNRLAGLELGEGSLAPAYTGQSILNLPASVCRWLGVPPIASAPLDLPGLEEIEGGSIRRVILVVVDALGLLRFRRWLAEGAAPIWQDLARRGILAPLTSVVPSTTTAALTSLWTGRSPSEHGLAGYELWLKEYGVVTNMINFSPNSYSGEGASLASLRHAGFTPDGYLPFPTLGAHLGVHGVPAYAFQPAGLTRSILSQMFFPGVKVQPYYTAADLWINLRRLLEHNTDERLFAWVYYSEIDTFSHRYGPGDERTAAEFSTFSAAFERFCLDRLGPPRGDTLFVLTADHGQISTEVDAHYDLKSHPGLARRLHLKPTGENRLTYLYVRPGQVEAVRETLERTWPNQLAVLDAAYAADRGLFGPGLAHPHLLDRLGDLIVAWRGAAYLWWAEKENRLYGRHGGLHPEEMLVPLLAFRL
jgi:hypothetical protein